MHREDDKKNMVSYLDTVDGVFESLHLLQPRSQRLFPRNEVASPQLIGYSYNLFSALSVHSRENKGPLVVAQYLHFPHGN